MRRRTKCNLLEYVKKKAIIKNATLTRKDILSNSLKVKPLKCGDKLFVKSCDLKDPFVSRSKRNNEIVMPNAYINTALWLLDIIKLSESNIVKDGYIYPALFCFRHYLELTMKDSIHYFKVTNGIILYDDLGYNEHEHSLLKLWNHLMPFLNNDCQVNSVKMLIEELHQLDANSTFYRYPFKHEHGKIKGFNYQPIMLNVDILKERMMQLYRFFEGVNHLYRGID